MAAGLLEQFDGGEINIQKISAFCQISGVILSSLKVEIDYLKVLKSESSTSRLEIEFMEEPKQIS